MRAIKAAIRWWVSMGRIAPEQYEQRQAYYRHMWSGRPEHCIWCTYERSDANELRPCPGPKVSA